MSFNTKSLERAATLRPEKLGAWFEDELKPIFKNMQEHMGLYYHRFIDSKAAGNLVADQPADFMLKTKKGAFLIEVKASRRHKSLIGGLSSLMRKEQAVHLRMWDRADGDSLVIFINVPSGHVEIWEGYYVGLHRSKGQRLKEDYILRSCSAANLEKELLDILF